APLLPLSRKLHGAPEPLRRSYIQLLLPLMVGNRMFLSRLFHIIGGFLSMTDTIAVQPILSAHGVPRLPSVQVESYNTELKDDEGFVGDRASKGAFRRFIEEWRK